MRLWARAVRNVLLVCLIIAALFGAALVGTAALERAAEQNPEHVRVGLPIFMAALFFFFVTGAEHARLAEKENEEDEQ